MEDKQKTSFLFNIAWRDVLMDYPAEVRYEVYDAIIEYAASGRLSELKPLAKMAFSFIKYEMDNNQRKYDEKVERNRANGSKGGAPKGNTNAKAKQPKTTETTQNNPMVEKTTETTLNDYDNDNDNDNDKEIDSTDVEPIKKGTNVPKEKAAEAATLSRKENFGRSLIPYVDKYGKEMIREFFDYWTEMNKSKSKMRFEQQPTWETSKRLATWAKRDKNYADNTQRHEDRRRGYDVPTDVEKDYNSTF